MAREEVKNVLEQVYDHYRVGDFSAALIASEKASVYEVDNKETLAAIKCSLFWKERIYKSQEIQDSYERAEYLFNEWNGFSQRYSRHLGTAFEKGKNAIRKYLFTYLIEVYDEISFETPKENLEIFLKKGKCYKGMGNYEKSIEVLEEALRIDNENPDVLAQLADSHALIDEMREAKVLFREAFFLGAGKVDIDLLESDIILKIIEIIKEEKSLPDTLIKEWIPVYGTVLGLFNIKRELRPLELGKLKQSVYKIKEEMKQTDQKRMIDSVLVPRLINRYFWLIDHYIRIKEDRGRVEEMLMAIKELDSKVWQRYVQ